ncbi:MAG: hypothetical protein IPG84_16390 [Betaproteobacteria bacterium]|nr:hypothetical protein [Betaproteobacteria bacterium]
MNLKSCASPPGTSFSIVNVALSGITMKLLSSGRSQQRGASVEVVVF